MENSHPWSLRFQIALLRAYLFSLDADTLPPDEAVHECRLLSHRLREKALDFSRQIVRAYPDHRGARELYHRLSA